MVFFAGALAGLVVGLAAGAALQRRAGRSSPMEGRRGFAIALALLALLAAAVTLANRGRDRPARSVTSGAGTTTSPETTNVAATTTTATSAPDGLISVPNVVNIARRQAVPILRRAGLEVGIELLPVSNVPADFVISQDPLPAASVRAGSTVTLVVTAAPRSG
jgi:hypothetical protein